MNPSPDRDVKDPCSSGMLRRYPEDEQMKFWTTAAWVILIGISVSACAFEPDNKPAYGQANGKKSDR
ncbi:hypothetical protein GCM10007857_54000 [Bradyrhizobium iriomotense]|uniref:Lipoprotein n=1 Tax=Bradyrhizobium iriomotense TaxID=441950 RepID=A0ABQ6B2P0_9BRAD|nr:hypothetical protein GCM10007857_54000 [Bradyrhizobium iriomotense]